MSRRKAVALEAPSASLALPLYAEDRQILGPSRIGRVAACGGIVRQEKTNQPIGIPQQPSLKKSLAASGLGRLVILTTPNEQPYTEKGVGNCIRKAAVSAGLPHCSAHGLRKAAARRLADAGCAPHEIMSITGHQSLKEVERYTREANRRALADGAIKRVGLRHEGGTKAA
ncbi:MAG: hypothetical protein EOO23_08465 [Comamonadaceae bacterium]|nr:MAG: hypothetical protein EOO23_08465 [Comamonadaceae bacterium]